MKVISHAILLICTASLCACFGRNLHTNENGGQTKHALIIGLSKYAEGTGWNTIHTENDLQILKKAILSQGFPKGNIIVLTDEKATKKGIDEALGTLKSRIGPGDIVYFHFSGHGQQIQDEDGDEIDGYDESIIPHDAHVSFKKGEYEGENHLTDDQLNEYFAGIIRDIGPKGHLLVTIDACHSGTATRGLGSARGVEVPFQEPGYAPGKATDMVERGQLTESRVLKGSGNMVAFFGSRPYQLNHEIKLESGEVYGSLSYAFAKSLTRLPEGSSYRSLFDAIQLEMKRFNLTQSPEADGVLDQRIMGGEFLGLPRYYKLSRGEDGKLWINGGQIHGITAKSEIAFFPPDTRVTVGKNPLATGTILNSFPSESLVRLHSDKFEPEELEEAWVFLTSKNFGELRISLHIDISDQSKTEQLRSLLSGRTLIDFTAEGSDLHLIKEEGYLKLINSSDHVLDSVSGSSPLSVVAELVKLQSERFAQASYLRKLEISNRNLDLEIDFQLVEYDTATYDLIEKSLPPDRFDENGMLHMKVGDHFRFRITNQGNKIAFFSVVDIQPNNEVNVLVPLDGDSPGDYRVWPGESFITNGLLRIGTPVGNELLLLVASEEPLDLREVIVTRGSGDMEAMAPFEALMAQTYFNEDLITRGGETVNVPVTTANILTFPFIIDRK